MVVVGRFGAPYGVKGWVRLTSYTDPASNLLTYRPWFVAMDGDWRELPVNATRPHGHGFVAHIDGLDDRSAVEALGGREIGVPDDALPTPEADEFYWKDLVGLTVVNDQGEALGRVTRLMATGEHDVLVVDGDAGELLIPFVRAVVTGVDLDAGRIVARWRAEY